MKRDGELDERFDVVKKALRSAESLTDVSDVQALLTHEVDEADVSGGAADEATEEAEEAAGGKARKARRPIKRGLYYAARRGKASILSEKLGLPVADLVANVTVHFSQELPPLDDMLTPEEAAKDFIDAANEQHAEEAAAAGTPVKTSALPGELRSTEGALAAAREVYARALVANIEVRRAARAHFTEAARLCLEATPKGKQEIDPTHELHRVVDRLHGRPMPLSELMPAPPPYATRERRETAVRQAELIMLHAKAERLNMTSSKLEVIRGSGAQVGGEDEADSLLKQLCACFCSTVDTALAKQWNEQRTLTVKRALVDLLYPLLAREAMEAATLAAHTCLTHECANRLRELALASPYRIAPARKNEPGSQAATTIKKKHRKQQVEKRRPPP